MGKVNIYGRKYALSFKNGDRVKVDLDAVADSTDDESQCETGTIITDLTIEGVYGCVGEENFFFTVKLDDGYEIGVNAHELKKL
jgi:hypothetical protein